MKTAVYDCQLHLEAFHLQGFEPSFPHHFHDHYVIGFVESGAHSMVCNGHKSLLSAGSAVFFNPGDVHACRPHGDAFDYRGFNIGRDDMRTLFPRHPGAPLFAQSVLHDEALFARLCALHQDILRASGQDNRPELRRLLSPLLQRSLPAAHIADEIRFVCDYMDHHFAEPIQLERLCRLCGWSKSTLLRAFLRDKGITPYRYLENIRIAKAKQLLEQGMAPAESALRTGFYDQSHFSRLFRRLTGLTPGDCRSIHLTDREKEHL